MTTDASSDLDVVLAGLDDLSDNLTESQRGLLNALLASIGGDEEVEGFRFADQGVQLKPSKFKPQLVSYTNGWGQDII